MKTPYTVIRLDYTKESQTHLPSESGQDYESEKVLKFGETSRVNSVKCIDYRPPGTSERFFMVSFNEKDEFHVYSLLNFGVKVAVGTFPFSPDKVVALQGIYNPNHSQELNRQYQSECAFFSNRMIVISQCLKPSTITRTYQNLNGFY